MKFGPFPTWVFAPMKTEPTEMAIRNASGTPATKACGAVLHKCYAFGSTHKYQVGRGIVEKA